MTDAENAATSEDRRPGPNDLVFVDFESLWVKRGFVLSWLDALVAAKVSEKSRVLVQMSRRFPVECRFLGFFFSSEGSQEAAMIGSLSEDKAGQVDQQKRDFLANLATHPARDFGAYLFLTSGEAITTKHNSLSHITTIENYDIKRKMSWAEVRMFSQHGQDYVFRDDTDNILLLARGLILSVEKAMEFSIQNKLPLNSKFVKAIIDGTTDCLVHLAKYAELMDKELRLPEDPAETQEKQ